MNQPLYERLIALHTETVTPLISEDRETTSATDLITILKATKVTKIDLASSPIQTLLGNILTLALSTEDEQEVRTYMGTLL